MFSDYLQPTGKVGLTATGDPGMRKMRLYAFKGFSVLEYGPFDGDPRATVDLLQGRPRTATIALGIAPFPETDWVDAIIRDVENRFTILYDFADFFTVNLDYRTADLAEDILSALLGVRAREDRYKPIAVRLDKTLSETAVDGILHYCRFYGIDAVVSTRYKELIEKTQGRFDVLADLEENDPALLADALRCGATLALLKSPRAGRRVLRRARKLLEEPKK